MKIFCDVYYVWLYVILDCVWVLCLSELYCNLKGKVDMIVEKWRIGIESVYLIGLGCMSFSYVYGFV